ncbi:MAG: TonB-dependent receptor [Polyangiaceae bacterium]
MTGRSFAPDPKGRAAASWTVAAVAIAVARSALGDEPPEVEVRGDRIASPPKEPSVAGSVIREERLRSPGLQAGDVLRTQPGVTVLETGGYGSPSTASIRGATSAQTPVYLAGIRLNDDVGGTADLSLVPLWLLHRVEIYRSNAPLAGDQLGIGGAIFFEPRRPRRAEVDAGVLGGSFGAHAAWALAALGDDASSGLVGIRVDGAQNDYPFVDDGGTRFEPGNSRIVRLGNADQRTADAWAIGSARVGAGGRLDVVVNAVDRDAGLPGLPLFPSTRARVAIQRQLGGLTISIPCEARGCEVTSTTAAVVSRARYDDPLREAALGTTQVDLDATRVEEALQVRLSASDRLTLTPAFRASVERLAIDAASAASVRAQRAFSRAAVQGEWTVNDLVTLRALASAECDATSHDGAPPWALAGDVTGPPRGGACGQFEPLGRAGAQIGSGPLVVLANVGRYARVPTLSELFGISGATRGNTALMPESGVSVDAGVRATASSAGVLRGASVDVFGFVRTASDLIAYERSWGYAVPYNVGSARVAGVELLAAYNPAPFVFFEVAATMLDPRNTSAARPVNDILPYQPELTVVPRVELRAKIPATTVDSGSLSVAYFYESSRYADPAGLVVIPEQGSLDVDAELGALRDRVVLRARLVNLLDQTRFDLIGYPLPGRAAYIAVEAKW